MDPILELNAVVEDLTDKIQDNEELIKSYQNQHLSDFERKQLELIKQQSKKMSELRHILIQRIRLNEKDVDWVKKSTA